MVTPDLPKFRTYAYGKNARQRLDAYWRAPVKSARAKPGPAVLLLHGGYWIEGDKRDWKYVARRLAGDGFTVFAADYRLAGPHAVWPAQRDDALAALRFVKKNAKRWNVDPGRIAVVGSSAGGMLATQLGTYGEGAKQVRGVVALSPVNNPYLAFRQGEAPDASSRQAKLRRAVVDLLGCVPGAVPGTEDDDLCWGRADDADAAVHASAGDAPMLLMHAAGDFVPVTHSTELASALRAAGVAATVRTVAGNGHGTAQLGDPGVYSRILAFLRARTR
ncbi:alpha/beta fold hydrolase [Actinomadura rayongensis]|uniref:Alpha/beta fold hydrolase n=2 Tax=Actinomadura rayongensis TaxID=1429076 RepID=A0A6I4WCZ4_9ACTN|nr:alpha/beta hydrolase [Actinomadura rayongensis]MXQ66115.1 alpha/beta fold hydrolase [Actinomadura rayongensis]